MPLAVEAEHGLGPQLAHDGDLLVDTLPSIAVALVERFIFDEVPADADAESEPAAAEHIYGGGLLGDERRLPLWQDEHAGHQLQSLGRSGQVAEEHEHFVERTLVGVGRLTEADLRPLETLGHRPEYVVVDDKMIEASPVDRLGVVA